MGLFDRFKRGLKKTRDALTGGILRVVRGRKLDDDLIEEIEEALLESDVGVTMTGFLVEQLEGAWKSKEITEGDEVVPFIKARLVDHLSEGGTALAGKSLMNAFTAGSLQFEFEDELDPLTLRQLMLPFERTARYCDMRYLPPFTVYGAGSLTPGDVDAACGRYTELLRGLTACKYEPGDMARHATLAGAMGGPAHG